MSDVQFEDSNTSNYSPQMIRDTVEPKGLFKILARVGLKNERLATAVLISIACLFFILSIIITWSALL